MSKYDDAIKIMTERFGKDCLISIATLNGSRPAVRTVRAYYQDGAFYTITYTLSSMMRQIAANPDIAVSSKWFTANALGENLGWVCDKSNADIMSNLREALADRYPGAGIDEEDQNTCLLRVRLSNGLLTDYDRNYGEGQYRVDFTSKTVMELSCSYSYQIVYLSGENRTNVIEVANPGLWSVVHYNLDRYKGQHITLTYSVDVKRVGAAGTLRWEVNNNDYPAIGNQIENAETNTWYTMSGEWTGTPSGTYPSFYLTTHESNSQETTYYIDNFTITITPA